MNNVHNHQPSFSTPPSPPTSCPKPPSNEDMQAAKSYIQRLQFQAASSYNRTEGFTKLSPPSQKIVLQFLTQRMDSQTNISNKMATFELMMGLLASVIEAEGNPSDVFGPATMLAMLMMAQTLDADPCQTTDGSQKQFDITKSLFSLFGLLTLQKK